MERRIRGELTLREALQEVDHGNDVIVLQPRTEDMMKNDFLISELGEWLKGCHLLLMENVVDQPEQLQKEEQPELEAVEMPDQADIKSVDRKLVKKPAGKKKVDVGKIMALHNAGRTNAWIADEMKMSEKSVWYYINKAKKETVDGTGKK